MNILLVYPEFPDTFWSFKHALKFVRKQAGAPPLGLLTVAAMLPSEWEQRLVDLNVTSLTQKDLAWADYVFVSAMIVQRDSARALIARCKEARVKVVAGGPLFTMEHDRFPDVDHFVLNEAELTLPPFLADLANGCAQPLYTTAEFPEIQRTPVPQALRYGQYSVLPRLPLQLRLLQCDGPVRASPAHQDCRADHRRVG
jgi:radical SAM superfamily enzyme YgiQ (UPF0313 family)